jgi:predicted ATP-dependent Lon-type protease
MAAAYSWDSCGTQNDRLFTTNLNVKGAINAGNNITVIATGSTSLHSKLSTGAWQVRVYELGKAHSIYTTFGDLATAVTFDDPANPTSFSLDVTFNLPKATSSGIFTASITGTDQDKASYFCLEVKYNYSSTLNVLLDPKVLPVVKHTSSAVTACSTGACKWDSCGTILDRLVTTNLGVIGAIAAGSNVTVVASGNTNLHSSLVTGAWEVRIYELGQAHSINTQFGDLTKVVNFNDPAAPTTFTLTIPLSLPHVLGIGNSFTASIVGTDQAKATYFCLEVLYSY